MMRGVTIALWSLLLVTLTAASADSAKPDPWAPVRFMLGRWEGTTQGEPGISNRLWTVAAVAYAAGAVFAFLLPALAR